MKIFSIAVFLFFFTLTINAAEVKDFTLPVFKKDENFTLNKHLGKKTIILNFFASWCSSCAEEIPELHALQKKHSSGDYIFVAINSGERRGLIKKFIKRYKFNYQILEDKNKTVSTLYGITSLPKTIVISKSKKITFFGDRPPKQLD